MHASLLDVLRCLGSQAADALVDCFRDERALSAARLACHALRTFIDSSTTSLTITVRAADLQRWEAGQPPPPLARRWPRCTHVTLEIKSGPGTAGEDPALLALLPFAEPGAGRQVETLRMLHAPGGTYGESLVCMLVPLLPKLRDLDFGLDVCMSFSPFKQQLMYSALASLPRLERLTLPGCCSLDHVGALAASLRCLTIESDGDDHLSPAAIAGLLQLQSLEELELPYCSRLGADGSGGEAPSGIRALLRSSLPPSLQKLMVGLRFDDGIVALGLRLHAGSLRRVTIISAKHPQLPALAQLLLCSPAMGPTLELLSIEQLHMRSDKQADLVPLRKLLQRCVNVQADIVYIAPTVPAAAVTELLPLLVPDEITLQFDSDLEVEFRFSSASGKVPEISGPTAGMSTGAVASSSPDVAALPTKEVEGLSSQQCSPPPGPADLLRAALQRMAVGRGPSSSQQAASSIAEGGAGGSGTQEGSLLLLQGPFLAMMAKSGLAPTEWVRCLAAQADAAAPGNDWGGEPVRSCQAVPLVSGVLLSCSSTTAAVAVAAVAAGDAAALVPLLEVLRPHGDYGNAKEEIFSALEPVMTAFWEGSALGGEFCTQHERLKCLLALRDAFNALPQEVVL